MALGNGNFNSQTDNNKKYYDPTVASAYTLRNPNGFDPSQLSFDHWKKLLKIQISPKMERRSDEAFDRYDNTPENSISIHLSPLKAMVLYNEIKAFKDGTITGSCGVNTGSGMCIMIYEGKYYGVNTPVLIIRKVDEQGNDKSSYAYQFNDPNTYTAIRNFDNDSKEFDIVGYDNLEFDVILLQLKKYLDAMTFSEAYTVMESNKYNASRTQTKLDLIQEKLGIEKPSKQSNGSSFFSRGSGNNSQQPQSRSASIDDIM